MIYGRGLFGLLVEPPKPTGVSSYLFGMLPKWSEPRGYNMVESSGWVQNSTVQLPEMYPSKATDWLYDLR